MYNQITSNKRRTVVLSVLFIAVLVALFWVASIYMQSDPLITIAIGFIFALVYVCISFFVAEKAVLAVHKAKPLEKRQAPELYRIVENLSIASGLPMPKLYVIDDPAPNAFAAGRDPKHASVTFTTGLLRSLNKLEVEAVAAHELSHIKQYDIRLTTIVVVLVGLIVLLADVLLRVGIFGDRRKLPAPVLIIALLLAALSPLIAQLVKLAISRTREYMADANGSLLTRHPNALASALEKIKDHQAQAMQKPNHATAHLFFANPFGNTKRSSTSWFARAFSTHPPIDERIARLRTMGT